MKIFMVILFMVLSPIALHAQPGYIEVTAPGNRQLKLAVDSPRSPDVLRNPETAKLISDVITFDMNMSGVVTAEGRLQQPVSGNLSLVDVDFLPWLSAAYSSSMSRTRPA